MKIAILCSSFYPVVDGVTIAVFQRVKYLSQLGDRVKLFCPDYSSLSHIYPNWQDYTGEIFKEIEVINLPSTKSIVLDFERDVTIKSYSIVTQELNKFQPDIIHVDEAERLGFCFLKLPGIKYAKQHDIPCIAWFHTNYIDYFDDYFNLPLGLNYIIKKSLNFIFSKIYNAYDLTIASSTVTRQKLEVMGIKNVYQAELLGCDLTQYSYSLKKDDFWQLQYSLPNIENKIKLIFIGRLTPDKGWNFTLEAFSQLNSEILKQIAIIIVGNGPLKTEINQTLKQLIPDIYLLGRIPNQSIPALLINSDILVTNSQKETRGLTIIEAGAAGIPAIAPKAGGVVDTIKDGETGLLYEPQNIVDFNHKLETLVGDRNLRRSMGTKAKATARQWSWQQTNNNLIDIWSREIANH